MFDVAPTELLLVAVVALVVIGPKDLPKAMRVVGHWVGRARGMARHFRSGIDEMIRQSELEEMEKKWREENERIMREFPTTSEPVALPDHSQSTASSTSGPDSDPAPSLPPPAQAPAETIAPVEAIAPVESPVDLANWHETPADPGAGLAAPETAPPPPRGEKPNPPGEEQLSLLPPDPPGGGTAGSDRKPPLP